MSRFVVSFKPVLAALFFLLVSAASEAAEPKDFGDAIAAAPDRDALDVKNDARRQPAKLIDFTGVKPGMVVFDMVAGGGYTTELMARAVGGSGQVFAQSAPNAPEKGKAMLRQRMARPAMANVQLVETPLDAPIPAYLHSIDVITLILNYHDISYLPVDRAAMNKSMFDGLKKGGVLVILDHAARAGEGASVSKTLHRIEETTVIREVEAAGFKKLAEVDYWRVPNDPKDQPFFQMEQPSDQFAIKFIKP